MLKRLLNARVFAPEDLGIRHVLVAAGRIVAVSEDRDDVSAAGAEEVDLGGATLVPGFIDGHAHITGWIGSAMNCPESTQMPMS